MESLDIQIDYLRALFEYLPENFACTVRQERFCTRENVDRMYKC